MCGIIGLVSNSKGVMAKNKKDFINNALLVDSLRGEDSTGLLTVNDKGGWNTFKSAMAGWDFIQHTKTKALLSSMLDLQLVVGHNRWATRGAITGANAHPFNHGKIIGVHNGSLRQHETLLEDGKDFDVDSDAVFHSINKVGVEATVKGMNGAYAIVFYNSEDNTVNMFRNEERPLWTAKVKHVSDAHHTILFASEIGMLDWVAGRNDMAVEEITLLKPHTLYTMDLGDLSTYTKTPLGQYKPPVYNYQHNNGRYLNNSSNQNFNGNDQLSHRRAERGKKLLADVGLNVNDELDFWVARADTYSERSSVGEISGCMVDAPYCDIIVHGVASDTLDLAIMEQAMTGKIQTANMRGNTIEIYLNKDSIRSTYADLPIVNQDTELKAIEDKSKKQGKKAEKQKSIKGKKEIIKEDKKAKETKQQLQKEIDKSKAADIKVEKEVQLMIQKAKDHQEGKVGRIKEPFDIQKVTEGLRIEKKYQPLLSLQGYKGLNGSFIKFADLKVAVQEGCQSCGGNIETSDYFNISWTNDHLPICPSCTLDLQDSGCLGTK